MRYDFKLKRTGGSAQFIYPLHPNPSFDLPPFSRNTLRYPYLNNIKNPSKKWIISQLGKNGFNTAGKAVGVVNDGVCVSFGDGEGGG